MYKSLEHTPFKIVYRILETGEYYLLANDDRELHEYSPEEHKKLIESWEKIHREYLSLPPNGKDATSLKIKNEIEYYLGIHKTVILMCDVLEQGWNDDLVEFLQNEGYQIEIDSFEDDIARVEREAEALFIKAQFYIDKLPPEDDEIQPTTKLNIDSMLASIAAILGIDFDFNTVSFTKVMAYKEQVDIKIQALIKQQPKK